MKSLFFFCIATLCYSSSIGQLYDSAIRYRMTTPTYFEAMDSFISQAAANPADTGAENNSTVLERDRLYMGSSEGAT